MTLTWWSLRGAQRRSNPEGSQPVRAIDSLMGTSSLPGEIVSGCRRTSGGDRRQVPATSVFENTPVAGHQCGIRHPRRGDDQPVSRVTMKYVWESVAFDRDLPLGHPVTLAPNTVLGCPRSHLSPRAIGGRRLCRTGIEDLRGACAIGDRQTRSGACVGRRRAAGRGKDGGSAA